MNEKENKKENKTGRYIYDKKTGKVVKISDEITSLKKTQNKDKNDICGSCNCPSCS